MYRANRSCTVHKRTDFNIMKGEENDGQEDNDRSDYEN